MICDAPYDSVREAAVAVLTQAAMPESGHFEYGGVVYELRGKYYCTEPMTDRDTTHIDIKVRLPAGSQLAGIYHTHPRDAGRIGRDFSKADVQVAVRIKLPSFLGVPYTSQVLQFIPGTTRVGFDGKSSGEVVK